MLITIPDFDQYLHYGDRKVPWVKLPRKLFYDARFRSVDDAERVLFLGLLVFAVLRPDGRGLVEEPGEVLAALCLQAPEELEASLARLEKTGLIRLENRT